MKNARYKDLEYFETLTSAENQLIAAENHHDELFLIDVEVFEFLIFSVRVSNFSNI